MRIAGIDIHTSPSIGIAIYPDDGTTIEALLAHADAAMYSAKQRGRGNFRRYAPGMHAGTEDRVQLESDLHKAVALNQFELYYQPKVDTRTGEVRSAEALIRWLHPDARHVSPADFIPLAEECGLIGAIGEWVMREACRQARAWQDDGVPPLRVSVNLSASQFRDSGLVDSIRRALDDAGLDAALSRGRTHRERGDERSRGIDCHSRAAERHGRAGVGGRLRHRLLEYELSAALPDRQAEDRPGLHRRDRKPSGRRLDRARHRLAGAQPAPQSRRRRRGDSGAARFLENAPAATNIRAITSAGRCPRRTSSG